MTRTSATNYPVGSPVQPGPEVAAQVTQLKRWTYALLGAAGLLLLALAAMGVFGLNLTASGEEPAPQEQPAARAEAAAAKTRVDRLVSALGGMGASHLFQSSLILELLADSVEQNVITKDEGEKKLRVMLGMMKRVEHHLKELEGAGLPAEEGESMGATRKVSTLIRREADALRAYWKTGAAEQETRYQAAHEATLTALAELMKE